MCRNVDGQTNADRVMAAKEKWGLLIDSHLSSAVIETPKKSATDLDHALHHAHHLVHDGNDFVRPLRRRHVGPVGRRKDEAAGHVQDVCWREFEVDCGAVGVVDYGRQECVLGCSGKAERWRKIRPRTAVLHFGPYYQTRTLSINANFLCTVLHFII